MLNHDTSFDLAFRALADGNRCTTLMQLVHKPASVSELAQPFDTLLPAMTQRLAVLENSGLVRSRKVDHMQICRVEFETLSPAEQWINQRHLEQEQHFSRLGAYLETLKIQGNVHDSGH